MTNLLLPPHLAWPGSDPIEAYLAPERIARVDAVLRQRIVSVTAVFEDVFDPHNVAACVRTCEGFGLQDLHSISNKHGLRVSSTVAKSADQWVDIQQHASTAEGIAALRQAGFAIWVSDLQAEHALADLPVDGKIALVVGNAALGISDEMRAAADQRYILPMHGMVQSYNLSVALAISLQTVMPVRRSALGEWGDMPMERMWPLRRKWLEYGVRNADIVRRHLDRGTQAATDGNPP